MTRKIVAAFVGTAFCLFELSCYSTRVRPPDQIDPNKTSTKIIGVVTKSGESYSFRPSNPARVVPGENAIAGDALTEGEIAKADIKSRVQDKKGNYTSIQTADGRRYSIVSSREEGNKVVFITYTPIKIPLSDVQQARVRKFNTGKTLLISGSTVVALTGVFLAYALLNMDIMEGAESCPFVYFFDGEAYVLDAEPYGAAVSEGLKRTDWVELSNLREVEGKYRLLLTNELDETQYTDELKLVAVDHIPGASIAPDLAGRIHTFSDPQQPVSAVDQTGRDILTFVRENDQVFWLSDLEERNPDGEGEFRDELTFEFAKPAGAKKAKLLANVWTTMWGSHSAGKYMELFGSSLEETYEEVDRHGPWYGRFFSWMAKEELYNLKVWVETPSGWKQRGLIMGGAPVITKDKAYILDVSDVPGEVLRLKLRPPVNFWMVNSLAVDYSEDTTVKITEIAAESVIDHTGRDARAVLAETDSLYIESPNFGERTELVFAALPLAPGLERTFLVKASGYYKAHVEASGESRTELIAHVFDEPGFAARYSLREYQKWAAGVLAKISKEKR